MLKTEGFAALLEVEMLKNALLCGAKHILKSKCIKCLVGPLLEVVWRPLSASVLSPKHATVAQWELSERVSFLAALSSLQHVPVVTSVVVGTLE